MVGGLFTWCGKQNNQPFSRLDHFLVLDDWNWEGHLKGVVYLALPRPPLGLKSATGSKAAGFWSSKRRKGPLS